MTLGVAQNLSYNIDDMKYGTRKVGGIGGGQDDIDAEN